MGLGEWILRPLVARRKRFGAARLGSPSRTETYAAFAPGARWANRVVILMSASPSSSWTALSGTPAITSWLASECRMSWMRTTGSVAARISRPKGWG